MKLDKIKFGLLIGMIVNRGAHLLTSDIEQIDNIIDVDVPEPIEHHCYPKNENVENLIKHMALGTNKIDAIREHRAITGMGLKESKDAIERYWPVGGQRVIGFTKGELMSKLNANAPEAQSDFDVIVDFINSL